MQSEIRVSELLVCLGKQEEEKKESKSSGCGQIKL